nr:hypothetical protein [Brevibacillus laterosporus]
MRTKVYIIVQYGCLRKRAESGAKETSNINEQDIEEVKQYMLDAQQMDMKFLLQLLEKLEMEGRNYIRNSRADIADLTHSYFYLCQLALHK